LWGWRVQSLQKSPSAVDPLRTECRSPDDADSISVIEPNMSILTSIFTEFRESPLRNVYPFDQRVVNQLLLAFLPNILLETHGAARATLD
jgi:hypothetical protein